ncbi:hypothetical protein YH67_18935 [Stenotrophomonas maltophilia]|jgi:hypothetical protein|nr:hypothetical protein YH67_18935 [Stenotrophomonas maltophilia]ALA92191.1 hypothetical protein YH68_18935 [Stenotrophomonas maltophilia]MBA0328754.1 hypothetical protein [Stenotrophomonas maltophilia]
MANVPALWEPSARKEVYDLLVALWPHLDEDDRTILVMRIAGGPPAWMSDHLSETDRDQLCARRAFERLRIMQRSDPERPHAALEAELARLRDIYPQWDVAPGDQAHFSFYSQSGWRTLDSVDDEVRLQSMTAAEIVEQMATLSRDDALDDWRQMVASDWDKMMAVLRGVAERAGPDPELWAATLWGLRTKAASATPGEDVLSLVAGMDAQLALDPRVAAAASYLLESAASSAQFSEMSQEGFWRAFDAVFPGVAQDDANTRHPDDHDWVAVAINTSMGNLALAFLNALFARRQVVGAGIPADLTARFIHLLGTGEARHLPARVVFASRLSYIFAVDPELARLHLLPNFMWDRDETEALAAWQGFGWQPHLDPLLWNEIKTDFLACFQGERIQQLGKTVGPLAQALAAAGLYIGLDDLPRQATQGAISRMDPETRAGVLHWIVGALCRGENREVDPDAVWADKVKPWILKFWPRDPQIKSTAETRPWVEMALATNEAFEDAVATVEKYIRPDDNDFVLGELAASEHVDVHPRLALRLMDAFLSPNGQFWSFEELRVVLDRILASDPTLRDDPAFARWDGFERARA